MKFRFIDVARKGFPVQRLCKVLGVSPSGYFAWKSRPASCRQRDDMVLLAHVRAAFALLNGASRQPAHGARVAQQRPDDRAIAVRRPPAGLIHHADRGSQYCSTDYQAALKKHGILISMSGKGNCYDNATASRRESSPPDCFLILLTFFMTTTAELVWRTVFQGRTKATNASGQYIDGFYNSVRRHSAPDFISPAQFERQAA